MDVDDINTFTEVIVNTFETTCNKKPFRTAAFQKVSGGEFSLSGLMCSLSFTGGLIGTVTLTMPEIVACKIYGGMMMEEVDEMDEEVAEGFTEIGNMIIGNIKADLGEHKLEFETPSVKVCENESLPEVCEKIWLYIPMAFDEWGEFKLLLCISPA